MVNWKSPAEELRDALAFEKLLYCTFGVYIWEIFMTIGFEWSLITKQRRFSWPLVSMNVLNNRFQSNLRFSTFRQIFYFLCRYCMLWALIGLIISINVTAEVDCGALYRFNSWTGNMAILCASTSLMIRTIAISERRMTVIIPLVILCLGHWGLLYHGIIIVQAMWDPIQHACVVTSTNSTFLDVNLFYTMGFDLVILVFTAAALLKSSSRSDLWHLLFQDGLVYWAITFTVNAVPAVFNILNLNTAMNIIATVPAACVATIAACRAVVRLQEYNKVSDVYVHSISGVTRGSTNGNTAGFKAGKVARFPHSRPEVQITTNHITMETFPSSTERTTPVSTSSVQKSIGLYEASLKDEQVEHLDYKEDADSAYLDV